MKWRKLANWLPAIPGFTHAAMPTYHHGRIYFSPRDSRGRSHIYSTWLNLDRLSLSVVLAEAEPGQPGTYDDAGCMVSDVRTINGVNHIYFVGWNLGVTVPFRNCIGLMKGFNKLYGPIQDRDLYDTAGVGACWEGLRWYTSLLGWERKDLKLRPRYHIVNGDPHSPAITFKDYESEWAIARPCVYRGSYFGDDLYRMWYCYRGDEYRIGYAESRDGLIWTRKDEQNIMPQMEGFDSDAQAYPCVFAECGNFYMLYNGNRYGETGFGLAILD